MRENHLRYLLLLADLIGMCLSFRVAYVLRYEAGLFPLDPNAPPFGSYAYAQMLACGAWILIFTLYQMGTSTFSRDLSIEISQAIMAAALLGGSLLAGMYLARTYFSRLLLILLFLLIALCLTLTRVLYKALLKQLRKKGIGLRRVVIVGDTELARELATRIRQRHDSLYEVTGFLQPATHRTIPTAAGSLLGNSEKVVSELLDRRVDELVFAIPIRRESSLLDFVAVCQSEGIGIKLIPEFYELHASQVGSASIDGIPIFELREVTPDPVRKLFKLILDYSLAMVLQVVLLPVFLVMGVLLWAIFRGFPVVGEVRIGRAGAPFTMYRFRVSPAQLPGHPHDEDWRVRICDFLYRFSLSELPQLWNVLLGEMSIVGPRPEIPERVRHYSAWHRRRLLLKPGITGLAQVKGMRGPDPSDAHTRFDLEYAATYSPMTDFTLMLATLNTLIRRGKARRRDPKLSGLSSPMDETVRANPN
jgi:lipopolysaccharide/colanic/teichoic acid biosynthesis glycosyltransferase